MKLGLCVASNYVGTPYALSGCVQDALDWCDLLGSEGYTATTLLNEQATRENILGLIGQMLERARWGDRVVITWSGHGTWVPDRSGDEVDQRDEALCPDDFQAAGLITDDDLAGVLVQARRGAGVLVLSDSCHSGTVTRFLGDAKTRARFLPTSVLRDAGVPGAFGGTALFAQALEDETPLVRTYTASASLISACTDEQVAWDAFFANGRPNGAFTRAAIDAYRQGQTLSAWFKAIRERLPNDVFDQSPQLSSQNIYRRHLRAL